MTILGFIEWAGDSVPHLQSDDNSPKLRNRGDNTYYGQPDVCLPELLEMFDGQSCGYVVVKYADRQSVLWASSPRRDGVFNFS